ncbi:hydrogenase accessory protein [Rhodobacteraceae bacterium CCMM004]|nr:hydrogenase accessory protein [Rhodobacteraceae bacterium CCMM004]
MAYLIDRLTDELGWPRLETPEDVATFTQAPGAHCLFVPGDPVRNLESTDAAVILPELAQAFQGRFDVAVVADAIEAQVREAAGVLKTPSLIFFREGRLLGGIPKVRDWSDYVARTAHILDTPAAA